jgi:hypothetical protein
MKLIILTLLVVGYSVAAISYFVKAAKSAQRAERIGLKKPQVAARVMISVLIASALAYTAYLLTLKV